MWYIYMSYNVYNVLIFETPWTTARQASLSLPSPRVCSNSCPLSRWCQTTTSFSVTPCLPVLNVSRIRVFSNELAFHIRWPKYWNFSISPSNEYLGLISFRMDWLDLLAVQRTLKSFLQHHSSKESVLWHSAFSMFLYIFPEKEKTVVEW